MLEKFKYNCIFNKYTLRFKLNTIFWCLFFSTKANKNKIDITRVCPVLTQLDNFINENLNG